MSSTTVSKPDIKWEDPPKPKGGPGSTKWRTILAEIREKPGAWANLGDSTTSNVANIRLGRLGGAQPGEFEAVMRNRNSETNRGTLYVRYVGTTTEASQ